MTPWDEEYFNEAVEYAKAGRKTEANKSFRELHKEYPMDPFITAWLADTESDLEVAELLLVEADANNPMIDAAWQRLEKRRKIREFSATPIKEDTIIKFRVENESFPQEIPKAVIVQSKEPIEAKESSETEVVDKNNWKKRTDLIVTSVGIAIIAIWEILALIHGTSFLDLYSCVTGNRGNPINCTGDFLTQSLGIGTNVKINNQTVSIAPNKGAIPDYPQSFAIKIPEGLKESFLEDFKGSSAKNLDVTAIEIPGSLESVKGFYAETLPKNGWIASSEAIPQDFVTLVNKGGGFTAIYDFNRKEIWIIGIPGTVAINGTIPIKSELDTILLIFSGDV